MRSFLTLLGILIGSASIILIVTIINGFSNSLSEQFSGLGSGSISIASYTPAKNKIAGKNSRISQLDLDYIKKNVKNITSITPIVFYQGHGDQEVRYKGRASFSNIQGTTHSYQKTSQNFVDYGRFITASDEAFRRKVCVIGETVKTDLDMPDDIIGTYISIGNFWCKVIGVLEKKGRLFGFDQDNYVIMPFSTMINIIGNVDSPDILIQIQLRDIAFLAETTKNITKGLRILRKIKLNDEDDFKVQTSKQLMNTFDTVANTLKLVFGGIVSISLLVGGIGVMNIMFVSVTERTREIGIAKALGAPKSLILKQFLVESILISFIGGALGVLIGLLISFFVSFIFQSFLTVEVELGIIGFAMLFSIIIGAIFGFIPAVKAANLSPIEGLRYE